MTAQLPIFIICLLVHTAIFLTSEQDDRKPRLCWGLAALFSAVGLAWLGGGLSPNAASAALEWLGLALQRAPYYVPLLSFLVYLRGPLRFREARHLG